MINLKLKQRIKFYVLGIGIGVLLLGLPVVFASTFSGSLESGLGEGGINAEVPYKPSASPVASTYTSTQSVSLSSLTSGATIRYTTNGTTPTCSTGTLYSGPLSVSSSQTIKAIACKDNGSSSVSSFSYSINITPSGGGTGSGAGAVTNYCSSVSYSDWGVCTSGFQYRSVISRSPSACTLTTAQQLSLTRECVVTPVDEEEIIEETGDEPSSSSATNLIDVKGVMNQEKAMTGKISTQLTNRLSGRILLQVEEKGQAWYVEPLSKERHFMGRPVDAFAMMRKFGLGINEINFAKFEKSGVPAKFSGRIFIRVEANGEAYYVNPVDMKMYYLNRPADAFRIMRELALGISNTNIRQIMVADYE